VAHLVDKPPITRSVTGAGRAASMNYGVTVSTHRYTVT
jgi:hypothetical protein